MSNSRTTNYRSPTWPPDYSSYTEETMGEEELVQILYNEANSSRAPDSYKKFISKLSEKMFELQIEVLDSKNQSKDYESKIKNTSIQCDTYADYLSTARENYDLLFEILQEERIQRMELEKKTMDLETEVEKLKNNNTQQQEEEANTNITTVITTTDQSSIPPSPSIVDHINVPQSSSSPQQQQQQSPSLSQPIQSPQQPSSVNTAPLNHDACHAQVKQYKDRVKDLERKMDRSATGRKNLEDQLVQYYKSMSMWETRAMDFDGENKRLQQLIQSKDMQLHDAQTQIHGLQSQLYNTQQHLRVIQQQHDQLSATSQQIVNNPQILKHLQLQHLRQLQQQQQQRQQQQQQQQSPLFGSPTNNTTSDNNNNSNNTQ